MMLRTSNLDRLRKAAKASGVLKKMGEKKEADKADDILAVNLTLGNTKLVFTEGGWKLDQSELDQYEKRVKELTQKMAEIQKKADSAQQQSSRTHEGMEKLVEECNMVKFKNQLLIEMLAIAQLDETHATQNYEREKLRAQEYKAELERCYSKMLMLGLDPAAVTLPAPGKEMSFDVSFKETTTFVPVAHGY